MAFNPRELRKAFGNFLTGVTVVTTVDADGQPSGFTANSFSSVSLDPPLLMVCMANNAICFDAFEAASGFAVNILTEAQKETSNGFATKSDDKFQNVRWQTGPAGNPLLEGVAAWFDCAVHARVAAGDHTILIGEIKAYEYGEAEPLGYFRGGYVTLGLERSAVKAWIEADTIVAGAIIERRGHILLIDDPADPGGSGLALPTAVVGGHSEPIDHVHRLLSELGLTASRPFLYSVYESASGDAQNIYYRYDSARGVPARGRFVPIDQVPWERLPDDAIRSMLRRYTVERAHQRYGVYLGDEESGIVR